MAGLEDFYPELRSRSSGQQSQGSSPINFSNMEQRPGSGAASSRRPWDQQQLISAPPTPRSSRVPLLIERPPRLVDSEYDEAAATTGDSFDMDHYASLGIGTVGLVLQYVATHPFIVLRRQCQVSSESFRCHRTPFTLAPVVVHLYRLQGFSSMWKGLGSALTVRGLLLAVEDCTGKFTPWPLKVDSSCSLRMVGQHLMLKAISQAVVVPFFSASLVESVQSDIASEKPGILDFLREGLARLGPQSGSRTLPMWLLIPPTVIHGIVHYIISTVVKTLSGKIMRSRSRATQEQQGAVSKPKSGPPGQLQYREQVSSTIGLLAADVILFPMETVLHRLHLQVECPFFEKFIEFIGNIFF
jgi:solute carrier family 25 protein 46